MFLPQKHREYNSVILKVIQLTHGRNSTKNILFFDLQQSTVLTKKILQSYSDCIAFFQQYLILRLILGN